MAKKLNNRQRAFVDQYMIDKNATQAAKRAGYSEKTSRQIGTRLLSETAICDEIQARMAKQSEETGITAKSVLSRLDTIADRCMQAVEVLDHAGEPTGEYKFDSSGANRALELLGKHLKLFIEKVEHTGPGGGPIQVITGVPE